MFLAYNELYQVVKFHKDWFKITTCRRLTDSQTNRQTDNQTEYQNRPTNILETSLILQLINRKNKQHPFHYPRGALPCKHNMWMTLIALVLSRMCHDVYLAALS